MKQRPYQPWSRIKVKFYIHYSRKNIITGEVREEDLEMGSVHDFTGFMQWLPELGMLIGFQPRHNQRLRENMGYIEGSMSLRWGEDMTMPNEVRFKDVKEFGKFLREHPEIAHALQVKV